MKFYWIYSRDLNHIQEFEGLKQKGLSVFLIMKQIEPFDIHPSRYSVNPYLCIKAKP